jgi:nitrite reductase (cytochrome c-552)
MPEPNLFSRPVVKLGLVAAAAALATVLVLALNASVAKRKAEAMQTSVRVVDLDESTVDPAVWGKNFPHQYDGYKRTSEHTGTKYGGGGSETLALEKLDADPRLKTIFDGYAFALDYRNRRVGFHAPQEAARVLGEAIDFSRQGQLTLRDVLAKQRPARKPKA